MSRNIKVTLIVLVVLALAGAAYGFAAANSFGANAPANVGYVASTANSIAGYEVSKIEINRGDLDQDIASFQFDLTPLDDAGLANESGAVAQYVLIQTGGPDTAWVTCDTPIADLTDTYVAHVTCPVSINFSEYVSLGVIASSSTNLAPETVIVAH